MALARIWNQWWRAIQEKRDEDAVHLYRELEALGLSQLPQWRQDLIAHGMNIIYNRIAKRRVVGGRLKGRRRKKKNSLF